MRSSAILLLSGHLWLMGSWHPANVEIQLMACALQPLPRPSQGTLWSDLLQHPRLLERSNALLDG